MSREKARKAILVTGGAGYVGSHSVLLLLEQDYRVVVIDNCSNSYFKSEHDANGNLVEEIPESLRRVEQLAGKKLAAFHKLDLVNDYNSGKLGDLFRRHQIGAVIHFAALKSVSESISLPLEYYTNNLVGTINLLNTMKTYGCRELIFSSSATVYGLPQYLPVDESHQTGLNVLNPYGRTKSMIEQMLEDLCRAQEERSFGDEHNAAAWSIISLRYFNPVGAHPSGFIGEHSVGTPNNLMPYIAQVATGKRGKFFVFGNDFNTPDGTGVRDYIHIMDLAGGHLHALEHLRKHRLESGAKSGSTYKAFNLGTGKGYSVLETIKTFEQVNGVKVPYEIVGRREGDAGEVYAQAGLALKELGWSAKYSLVDMVRDTYRWQLNYPDGYKSPVAHEPDVISRD